MLAIVATDLTYGLAKTDTDSPTGLPWVSTLDLQLFAYLSKKSVNWVSKSTFLTLPPHVQESRHFCVLTRNPEYHYENKFEELVEHRVRASDNKQLLIGGLKAYEKLIPWSNCVIHTIFLQDYKCDIKLPPSLLGKFNQVMRIYSQYQELPSGPPMTIDVYYNNSANIPVGYIKKLAKLTKA